MTLRRYSELKPTAGTRWPDGVRATAYVLMPRCVGPAAGMGDPCYGGLDLHHIRGSGALGRKSRSTLDNAARLCATHHREAHRSGKTWRPRLIEVVNALLGSHETHVDPCGAPECIAARVTHA